MAVFAKKFATVPLLDSHNILLLISPAYVKPSPMSCPDCFQGHIHDGTPVGTVTKIHGRSTYVVGPSGNVSSKGIIIIVSDAFGWEFVNNRLLADQYARQGEFLVYLPDFMDGHAAPNWAISPFLRLRDSNSIWDWTIKPFYIAILVYAGIPFLIYNRFAAAWPKIRSFFEAVRLEEGSTLPIGAAGFCWGGKSTVTLTHPGVVAKNGRPMVDAVFTGHPSGLSLPNDIEKITRPAAIAIGDQDRVMPMTQVEIVRGAWGRLEDHVPTEVVVYPGAGHGFCVRVDPKNENQFRQSREAEKQAVNWFRRHLQ